MAWIIRHIHNLCSCKKRRWHNTPNYIRNTLCCKRMQEMWLSSLYRDRSTNPWASRRSFRRHLIQAVVQRWWAKVVAECHHENFGKQRRIQGWSCGWNWAWQTPHGQRKGNAAERPADQLLDLEKLWQQKCRLSPGFVHKWWEPQAPNETEHTHPGRAGQ